MSITEASVTGNVHYFSPVSADDLVRDSIGQMAAKQRRKNQR